MSTTVTLVKAAAQTQIKSEPAAQPAAGVFNFGLKNKDAKATIIASTTTVDKKGEQMVKKGAALLVKGSINITNGAACLSPEEMAKAATSKEAASEAEIRAHLRIMNARRVQEKFIEHTSAVTSQKVTATINRLSVKKDFCAVDTTGRDSSSLDIQAEPTIAVDGGDVDAAASDPFTQGVVWVQGRGIFYARDGVCKGARISTLPRELWPIRSMHANARGGGVVLSASGAVALLLLPAVSGRDFSEPRILVNSSATAVAVDVARGLIFVAFKDRTVRLLSIEVTGEVQRVPVLQRKSLRLQQKALGEIVAMAVDPGTRVLYLVDDVGPAGTDFGHSYDDDDVDHDAEEDGADVTLVVGPDEKEFRAHRAVLLARCAFFRPFLLGGFYVRVERELSMRIRLPDDTPVIFERILEHLYSGSAQHVPWSDLLETAAAADRFMLFEFRNALLARATAAMTPGTFVQMLAAMRRLAAPPPEELMRAALRYYVDNQEPILRDHEASVGVLIAQEPGLVLKLLGAVASGSASGSAGPQTRPHKRRRHLEA
ncbi:hypothetical protein HYH03_002047 [Edaphochlamys debaryana]|uniref:BTB domain-containing protein n=1 Tax=Edaphochlamys debaryana TaxID=47281 RepID=A0A835YF01_9CHLO|nr:hypothetical protein HYH03_002047 [Edaphochlamys debaryana]|eukprot:KAG2500482.1 hypothetical protein HYH03_002047 [Edaphochlamys debaryana]